ncbi:M48 family metallopeptidase [Moraxella nasovis]|uniref:M48 family metallopeptidase n=1 Tax=Moraxella nasovis TaxID=2904121 RepID=UPI001F626248|nr:YgjP-like metallopeptidase domain-containing protein [Moraxella nasovis]UNU73942.1 M48 family metallopeptidase [Moraxella nasovis]
MYTTLKAQFAHHGIWLIITKKSVKNINFRMKPNKLYVSIPHLLNPNQAISLIESRLAWAIDVNAKLIQQNTAQTSPILWGRPLDIQAYCDKNGIKTDDIKLSNTHKQNLLMVIYRQALQGKLPILAQTWQPIVGRCASEIRLKKMTTRWGGCNTHSARVWLSIYLAAYPYECTEYVFVHELCHLHHANHSKAFWQSVEQAMPDYRKWHNILRQRSI